MAVECAVKIHCRWMVRRDLEAVLRIERESYAAPWVEDDFLRALRQRNCIGMVAEHGETILGFFIYELAKTKLHVMNMAVHPDWRRKGVGAQMVRKLTSKLSTHRRTRVTLETRESNLDAQLFFRKQGFRAIKVLRGFYPDTREDAYVMRYQFAEAPKEA